MARKESEKDSERPHYYSQFWLDVASGRRVIGAPTEDEDTFETESMVSHRAGRNTVDGSDGYHEEVVHPDIDAIEDEEEDYPEAEDFEVEDTLEDTEIPNIDVDETEDLGDLDQDVVAEEEPVVAEEPAVEVEPVIEEEPVAEEEPEVIPADGDFEEDEEDEEWPGRGRKKPKPRTTRLPAKRPKREPRRGY